MLPVIDMQDDPERPARHGIDWLAGQCVGNVDQRAGSYKKEESGHGLRTGERCGNVGTTWDCTRYSRVDETWKERLCKLARNTSSDRVGTLVILQPKRGLGHLYRGVYSCRRAETMSWWLSSRSRRWFHLESFWRLHWKRDRRRCKRGNRNGRMKSKYCREAGQKCFFARQAEKADCQIRTKVSLRIRQKKYRRKRQERRWVAVSTALHTPALCVVGYLFKEIFLDVVET